MAVTWLDWLAHKDWDVYLKLQEHVWHARMKSVLQQIKFPPELYAQVAFYRGHIHAHCCWICHTERAQAEQPVHHTTSDVKVRPAAWLSGDIEAPHFLCQQPARFRLLLAGQSPPPDYAYLNECGWKPPRVFDIKAQGDPDAFARRVIKDVLIQTLQNNGIAFKRSWNKAKLWRALLSHK